MIVKENILLKREIPFKDTSRAYENDIDLNNINVSTV